METEEILEEKTEDIMNQSCFRSKRTRQEYDGVTNSACTDIVSSSCDEKPASDMVYSLCSVIVHSGTSSESGHYYCYARSCAHLVGGEGSDDGASSRTTDQDTWFLFNDSRVSYSAYSSFSDVSKRFPKDTPYVLIYKRISSFGTVTPVSTDAQAGEIKPELADLVNRDNLLYLKEQERQAVNAAKRKPWSHVYQPPDDDDNDNNRGPPGSCGSGPGFTTPYNRFVF